MARNVTSVIRSDRVKRTKCHSDNNLDRHLGLDIIGPRIGRGMKKALCYIRVSTLEQSTQGVSLEAQEERLRAYCAMAKLDVVAVLREEGVSGARSLGLRPRRDGTAGPGGSQEGGAYRGPEIGPAFS